MKNTRVFNKLRDTLVVKIKILEDTSYSSFQKTRFCHILLNNYFEDLTNRSISNSGSLLVRMSKNSKQWWVGLPDELQKDIEFEE